MSLGIHHMSGAARAARLASTGGRTIEIVITEEGMIVSGRKGLYRAAVDLRWPELDGNPELLRNAVSLVAARLP